MYVLYIFKERYVLNDITKDETNHTKQKLAKTSQF